jgi:hypothetical protein
MTPEEDIHRTAKRLIREHGEAAKLCATERGERLLEAGDAKGALVWCRIAVAITELQSGRQRLGPGWLQHLQRSCSVLARRTVRSMHGRYQSMKGWLVDHLDAERIQK